MATFILTGTGKLNFPSVQLAPDSGMLSHLRNTILQSGSYRSTSVAVKAGVQERKAVKCLGSTATGLGLQSSHSLPSRPVMRSDTIRFASVVCAAALGAKCSASGQTQTVTRETTNITVAPIDSKEKSPDLDDGGAGFPPRDDDDGGGGGGGGDGWKGGFFFFGFLAFLGFLKDNEREGNGPYSRGNKDKKRRLKKM